MCTDSRTPYHNVRIHEAWASSLDDGVPLGGVSSWERARFFFGGWMCKYQKYPSIFTSHLHIFAWIIMNMHVLIDWVDRSISPSIDPSLHRSIVCLFAGWLNGCFLPFLAFPSSLSLAFPFLSLPFPFPSSLFFSSDVVLVPRLRALWISYAVLHGQRYSYIYHYVIVVNPWQSRHDTCIISHRSLISLISFTFQWLSFLKHVQPNIMQCFVDGICIQGRNWRMVCNPVIPVWKAAKNSKPRKANHQMTFKSLNGECIQYFMHVYMIAYVHGILFCRSRPYQLCNSGPLDAILYDLEAVFNNMNLSLSLSPYFTLYIHIILTLYLCFLSFYSIPRCTHSVSL